MTKKVLYGVFQDLCPWTKGCGLETGRPVKRGGWRFDSRAAAGARCVMTIGTTMTHMSSAGIWACPGKAQHSQSKTRSIKAMSVNQSFDHFFLGKYSSD